MSISAVRYPSIHAKLYGMYAKKLKKEQLEELIKQNTITQAIALLKNFQDSFKQLKEDSKRMNLKIVLDDILIEDIQKIARCLNQADREKFMQFLSIHEIKCIKSVLRKLSSGNTIQEQSNDIQNWTQKIFKKLKGIWKIKDEEELIQFLKKTPYEFIFNEKQGKFDSTNIFEWENKLDKFYFEKMLNMAEKYNHSLKEMLGKEIDLNNIIWIYRVKKNYNFSPEKIKDILIDRRAYLKKSELEELMQCDTEETMLGILKNTYYAKYIDFDNFSDLEQKVDQYLYRMAQKVFRSNIFDISTIYAYINLVEKENNDIMNIVEGIRYHLDRDEIRKKLVQ